MTAPRQKPPTAAARHAILDALPANIALVDATGVIVAVNDAWRRFAADNNLGHADAGVGLNYFTVCERGRDEDEAPGAPAAAGLRRVLAGEVQEFTLEYACHAPAEKRWFRLVAAPWPDVTPPGAVVMHLNITERELAEQALRVSEENFRRIFEDAGTGIAITGLDGHYLEANAAYCRMLGYTEAELRGRDVASLTHPDDRARDVHLLRELSDGRRDFYRVEKRYLARDGRVVWGRISVSAQRDRDGRPYRFIGVAEDFSERKRAEEALRQSEERFRELAENIDEIFYNYDPDNRRLLYVNQAYERIWGRPLAAVYADVSTYLDGIHPEDRPAVEAANQRQLAGENTHIEFRVLRPDGTTRWIQEHAVPVRNGAGRVERVVGTMRDITEQKAADARIHESEERFRLLSRATTDAIWDWDPVRQQLWWNEGFASLLGQPAGKIEPSFETWAGRLHAEDRQRVLDAVEAAMASHRDTFAHEYRFRRADGTYAHVLDRGHIIRDAQGHAVRLIGGMSDLTERKHMERQFLRVQRMENIGSLAGGIAHDLNNILAPIMMSVGVLRREVSSAVGREMLESLQSCAQRGADLVQQVLSFARGLEGQRIPVNPLHLLRDIQKIIRETFPKNIEPEFRLLRSPRMVTGDPTQLHQVLMNLCVNARDAMPQGGRLTLRLEELRLDDTYASMTPEATAGPHVVISVTDTGIGIPRAIRDQIFEPFFTTKDVGKGTGLGLSTSLAIVRSHGGFITVDSEPGQGATFKVHLPADPKQGSAGAGATDPGPLPHGSGELVLVVDDEEMIRRIATQTLEQWGYRVLVAKHGAEAIACYAAQRDTIAVVLTDMAMPVMDGPALIVALKAINPDVRIVASSGLGSAGGVAKAMSAGIRQFVPKPYTAEQLIRAIGQALGKIG